MANKLCNVCGLRRVGTTGEDPASAKHSGICGLCYDEGAWENTHSDHNHDRIAKEGGFTLAETTFKTQEDLDAYLVEERNYMEQCWICHPELNLAQTWKPGHKGSKAQGARRPQLNHKGHKHPQSPAARRACKLAFWAAMAEQGITPANVLAEHFLTWDHDCDSNGKPWPAKTNTTPMTVVATGPKGGVVKQLKASKPAAKGAFTAKGLGITK